MWTPCASAHYTFIDGAFGKATPPDIWWSFTATLLKPSATAQDIARESTHLLLDVRLVGGKQAAQGSGVQVPQGVARRGRPLRSRLGHTHLLTRRQLPLRSRLTIETPGFAGQG